MSGNNVQWMLLRSTNLLQVARWFGCLLLAVATVVVQVVPGWVPQDGFPPPPAGQEPLHLWVVAVATAVVVLVAHLHFPLLLPPPLLLLLPPLLLLLPPLLLLLPPLLLLLPPPLLLLLPPSHPPQLLHYQIHLEKHQL